MREWTEIFLVSVVLFGCATKEVAQEKPWSDLKCELADKGKSWFCKSEHHQCWISRVSKSMSCLF